jgi:hypothetical protein
MTVLIKELIEVPDRVHKGDFVLRLSEGVQQPEETLRDYVVTPQLADCFDNALGFVAGAVGARTSKAAYLHGSFGSGKSHFMAVLYLLLNRHPKALSIPELAPAVARHSPALEGKRFLLVPYHMIGARNLESAILGGYADYIRKVHPEAPTPAVYVAEAVFRDACALRESLGDAKFFERLNKEKAGGEWGDLEAKWDARRFEAALDALPGTEERSQLVSALVDTFFGAYREVARGREETFVPLDQGLSVLSRHAAGLGYNAVVLFLDELILWLASHAADLKFIHQEGQKLAKLVEAQTPDRPAPLVSFVARQRDLRDLVGDSFTGADRLSFSDALKHLEGRFHLLPLDDRNLPAIAAKRLLRPRNEAAGKEIEAAFEQTARVREEVLDVLLTSKGDRDMFRKVYPFSPALVEALVAVSSMLQRERTALRVMLQILVEQKDTLRLGDLVPVGDLFDLISHGEDAFTDDMRIHFENANRLYQAKLLPQLERAHGRRKAEILALPYNEPARAAFRADDRLVKTLLLSALVPGVEAFRSLTAGRLAALNHGSIRTPIPGREGQEVLARCKNWASAIGEIRVGEEANPTISVQLTGVDTESILAQARGEDNQGNRIRLVRRMVFDMLGIGDRDELFLTQSLTWRGTRRPFEVVFGNISLHTDASLDNPGDTWRLLVDFPFDDQGRTPQSDLDRLQKHRSEHTAGARTLAWIPSFFSRAAKKDLGTLVVIEHILAGSGERFQGYSAHLSLQDRATARTLLENQRSQLRIRVTGHLEAAYGIGPAIPESVDPAHDLPDHFESLLPGFDPQAPAAANLKDAMAGLVDQALSHQYPAHPLFETEPKPGKPLNTVLEEVLRAIDDRDGRVLVERDKRPVLRQVALPLKLGEMTETHFLLLDHWKNHFNRKLAEPGGAVTAARLRQWMDEPRPMGLPREVQNLLILLFARQTNRQFYLHGGQASPTIASLQDALELREPVLPGQERWDLAIRLAGAVLGVTGSPLLNLVNSNRFAAEIVEIAEKRKAEARLLVSVLEKRLEVQGLAPGECARFRTASASAKLAEALSGKRGAEAVEALASAEIPTSGEAMGMSLATAAEVRTQIEAANWELFALLRNLGEEHRAEGEAVVEKVHAALRTDQVLQGLGPVLKEAQAAAVRIIAKATPRRPVPPEKPPVEPPEPTPPTGVKVVERGAQQGLDLRGAREVLGTIERKAGKGRTVRVDVSWRVEEGGGR